MPLYSYKAVALDGRNVEGSELADDRGALEKRLKGRRLLLMQCKEIRPRRIPRRVEAEFMSQLSSLLGSGIPVDRALYAVSEDAEDKRTAELAAVLRQGLARGNPLSLAMAEAGRFDAMVIPLIRAGEASGEIGSVCARLNQHFDSQRQVRNEIVGSLTYPVVLVFAGLLALVGLGIYVIPTFRDLFVDRFDTLPASTRALFFLSELLVAHGWTLLAILTGIVVSVVVAYRTSAVLRFTLQDLLLNVPVIGRFLGSLDAANVMTVLGVLLANGLHLSPALEIAQNTALNGRIRRGLGEVLVDVRRGNRLASACDHVPRFPRLARRLIAAGEETGRLHEACTRAGQLLQEDVQARIKTAVRLLEPMIILLTGGAVGFVVVSMLQGVYSLTSFK